MKILVDIGHPAHVHLFKNMIWELENKGHEVKITARDKDVALKLLDAYEFNYEFLGEHRTRLASKISGAIKTNYRLYKIAKKFNPDILIGASGNFYIAQIARLIGKPSIIFEDSEPDQTIYWLCEPFATAICTPFCFKGKLNPKKHVRYDGYKELAYLHPNYFIPDSSVLNDLDLGKDDGFVILRFVAWKASHDIGRKGLDLETKRKLVNELERYHRVFITSESKLPKEFEKYRITIPPHRIHNVLYYAQMLVGDTQTMTTEAGILGTPAIRCNSFVGEKDMGNFIELEKKYDLIYSYRDPDKALNKVMELLKKDNLKREWQKKRDKLLNEKIDVTKFMTEFIENYPRSFHDLVQRHKKPRDFT
jgi:predicted glycosyltransferase